jgi:23S rRNA (adenine1618-N6)-methyltransferase
MHLNNPHQTDYDFAALQKVHPKLSPFVINNPQGKLTIDFANTQAVLALNKAILSKAYSITNWELPEGYLCPAIPGRADYIHHLADLLPQKKGIAGLDVGTGANAIYTLLGNVMNNWMMVGCDSNATSVAIAQQNTQTYDGIEIRHQNNKSNLFKGIINPGEYFDFTMCNPPFYASEEEAVKAKQAKQRNLNIPRNAQRNFAGQANELWCNGGEALFIKRLIKESVQFSKQVGWFTSLVSRKQNLEKITKQLDKLKATHQVIPMEQGKKKSRLIAWKFSLD